MTREEVKKLIEETLLGKNYNLFSNVYDVKWELNKLYPNLELSVDYNARDHIGYVQYKKYSLIGFYLRKKKGDYHFGCYDWTISKVDLFNWFENLEDRIAEIDKQVVEAENKKQQERQVKVDNFKKVRALFPDLDWLGFEKTLKGIIDVCYDEIKKEGK